MKHFYDLKTVESLTEGEKAFPQPSVEYRLRTIDNRLVGDESVKHVVRAGDILFAVTVTDEAFPVTGEGQFVLVPLKIFSGL